MHCRYASSFQNTRFSGIVLGGGRGPNCLLSADPVDSVYDDLTYDSNFDSFRLLQDGRCDNNREDVDELLVLGGGGAGAGGGGGSGFKPIEPVLAGPPVAADGNIKGDLGFFLCTTYLICIAYQHANTLIFVSTYRHTYMHTLLMT